MIWKKVRKGEIAPSEAEQIIRAFISNGSVVLRPSRAFLQAAFEIASKWDLTVYDSLYLAVALDESCSLVTADERLGRDLRGTALERTVRVLGHR